MVDTLLCTIFTSFSNFTAIFHHKRIKEFTLEFVLKKKQPAPSSRVASPQCKISWFGHIAFIFCTEISIVLNMGNISTKKKYQYSLTKPKLNSFVKLSKTCHSYDVTQNIKNGQFILCRICTTLTLSYLAVNWC